MNMVETLTIWEHLTFILTDIAITVNFLSQASKIAMQNKGVGAYIVSFLLFEYLLSWTIYRTAFCNLAEFCLCLVRKAMALLLLE